MGEHRSRAGRRLVRAAAAGVLATTAVALLPASPAPATEDGQGWEYIAEGLENPRGIAVGRGRVYVAEAGSGGETCEEVPSPEDGSITELCLGDTGSITRIRRNGRLQEVVGGLPSLADGSGSATGIHDVTVDRGLHYLIGNVGDVANFPASLIDERFGKLYRGTFGGSSFEVADISAFEVAENPDPAFVDTNPYGLQTDRRGRHYVADAGGNDLLRVDRDGTVSLSAVFPGGMAEAPPFIGAPPGTMIPYEPVPNAVDVGPDGRPYVGQLTGFPFPVDQANVYRVDESGTPEVYASGFTNIIDITFGPDGELYVLELVADGLLAAEGGGGPPIGALYEVAPGGGSRELLSGSELVFPGGVAVGRHGDLYVTVNSTSAGEGAVIRYDR